MFYKINKILLPFVFIVSACIAACQVPSDVSMVKDGKLYGVTAVPFKGQWWHYYERALSFADGGFWKKAEADLREAVKKRKDDKKNARTYGRHFLALPEKDPGFFPHRELGIVLYRQGRIEEAVKELSASLEFETSARAQLYLDRARKILIKQNRLDHKPPGITLEAPGRKIYTNASAVLIRGNAIDDTFVRHIRIGGKPVRIDVSAKKIPFRMKIRLNSGKNNIPVIATDLTGKETTEYLQVIADWIGPVISYDSLARSPDLHNSNVIFKGYTSDNFGIAEIIINGEKKQCHGKKEILLEQIIPLQQVKNSLEIKVKDVAGNLTSMKIPYTNNIEQTDLSNLLAEHGNSIAGKILENNKRSLEKDFINKSSDRVKDKDKSIEDLLLASSLKDLNPPDITINRYNDKDRKYLIYLDEVLFEGSIEDDTQVKKLWLNGKKIELRGKKNAFTYIHPLEEGDNHIFIRGVDVAGNEVRRNLMIVRKVPLVKEYESRLSLEIKEFKEKPEKLDISFDLKDRLDSIMFEKRRFQVLTEDEIDEGLRADCALKGSIRKRLNYVEISANLYQLGSDSKGSLKRLAKVDAYRENENTKEPLLVNRNLLKEIVREIHLKLADEIPLAEGMVMDSDGKASIATDLGEDAKIKKGMDLIVFEKNESIPGKDFKTLGQAEINNIKTDKSYAKIKEGEPTNINRGHHVITR